MKVPQVCGKTLSIWLRIKLMGSLFIGPTWADLPEERDETVMPHLPLVDTLLSELELGHSTYLTWRD